MLTACLMPAHAEVSGPDPTLPVELKLELGQGFDNNVYRVDQGSLAGQGSPVSHLLPEVRWHILPAWNVFYAGRANLYWNDRSEDNIRHNIGLRGSFDGNALSGAIQSTLTRVQGSHDAVIFDAGRNAFSTAAVRERRAQWQNRSSGHLIWEGAALFLRGSGHLLYYDLDTVRKPGVPGYDNYVNRYDLRGGIEVGRRTRDWGAFTLGFQQGYQHQGRQGGRPTDRSNPYQRYLLGWKLKADPVLTLAVEAGPALHHYANGPGTTEITDLYLNASATLRPNPKNTLQWVAARRKWVSSTGLLSNTDLTGSMRWTHRLTEALTFQALALARGLDYDGSPVNDWVYTGGLEVQYRWHRDLMLSLDVERNFGRDRSRHLPGRTFNRTWVGIRANWSL